MKNNREPRLNPLHCGAVVASPRPRIPPPNVILCLNPLHCGAVVASHPLVWVGASAGEVSIPFIAGQWSLLVAAAALAVWRACLNPLHCGAVVASGAHACASGGSFFVSIPFIAGQWSLPRKLSSARCAKRLFQSPSLRGSGRFLPFSLPEIPPVVPFQSPSLRGSGRFVLCFSSR